MDYGKLDAGLAAALSDTEDDMDNSALSIFIHAKHNVGPDEAEFLKQIGVDSDVDDRQILTATVSPKTLEILSAQPWVKYLRLSRTLRPLRTR